MSNATKEDESPSQKWSESLKGGSGEKKAGGDSDSRREDKRGFRADGKRPPFIRRDKGKTKSYVETQREARGSLSEEGKEKKKEEEWIFPKTSARDFTHERFKGRESVPKCTTWNSHHPP